MQKGIRMPEELKQRIEVQAERSARSESNYIKFAIENQLRIDEKREFENLAKMIEAKAKTDGVDKIALWQLVKEQLL